MSLEDAKAKPISEAVYKDTLQMIRDGPSYVTGSAATVPENPEPVIAGKDKAAGPGTRAGLGGLVGLMLGVGLVLLLDRFDGRLRTRKDVETVSGLTVIAEIPRMKRKVAQSNDLQMLVAPRSRAAEGYRAIRGVAVFALNSMRALGHVNGTQIPAAVLMVASSELGEGKTVTSANLAVAFVEGGLNLLVLNCDFRRPRVHHLLLPRGRLR